ncbi:MAG: hypothetical protein WBN03_09355 [Desulfobacterales bacterium]
MENAKKFSLIYRPYKAVFRPQMALFCNFGVNLRNRCATYTVTPPRNAADFLDLAENCTFLDRKLTSALKEAVDGHKLNPNVGAKFCIDTSLANLYIHLYRFNAYPLMTWKTSACVHDASMGAI